MQAIVTAYHGPTNTRGSRIYARCLAGRLSVEYDDALNIEENHVAAAKALILKLGWGRKRNQPSMFRVEEPWAYGTLPSGDYCHVIAREFERYTVEQP